MSGQLQDPKPLFTPLPLTPPPAKKKKRKTTLGNVNFISGEFQE